MPFVGEVIPLSLQLADFQTGKFPRAVLRDEGGATVAGSPVALTHIGDGKYTSDAIVMPAGVDYIEITYQVFASAADRTAGTPLDPAYLAAKDVSRFEIPDSVLKDLLDQILLKVCSLLNIASGELLVGVVQDDGPVGVFDEEVLIGVVDEVEQLKSTLTATDLAVLLKAEELVGILDCD